MTTKTMLILGLIAGLGCSEIIIDQAFAQQPKNNVQDQIADLDERVSILEKWKPGIDSTIEYLHNAVLDLQSKVENNYAEFVQFTTQTTIQLQEMNQRISDNRFLADSNTLRNDQQDAKNDEQDILLTDTRNWVGKVDQVAYESYTLAQNNEGHITVLKNSLNDDKGDLQQEIKDRISGDELLQFNINDEVQYRLDGDHASALAISQLENRVDELALIDNTADIEALQVSDLDQNDRLDDVEQQQSLDHQAIVNLSGRVLDLELEPDSELVFYSYPKNVYVAPHTTTSFETGCPNGDKVINSGYIRDSHELEIIEDYYKGWIGGVDWWQYRLVNTSDEGHNFYSRTMCLDITP